MTNASRVSAVPSTSKKSRNDSKERNDRPSANGIMRYSPILQRKSPANSLCDVSAYHSGLFCCPHTEVTHTVHGINLTEGDEQGARRACERVHQNHAKNVDGRLAHIVPKTTGSKRNRLFTHRQLTRFEYVVPSIRRATGLHVLYTLK